MPCEPTRRPRFGALLRQTDNQWTSVAESARICDDLGFHSIYFIDHLLAIPDPAGDILEAWTTMTRCAGITRRVRVGGNVLCNSFRSPALLAKMAATLDVISGGRLRARTGGGVARTPRLWVRLSPPGGAHRATGRGRADRQTTVDRRAGGLRRAALPAVFICLFTDGGRPDTVRLFGERVLPAFL
jgi:hypothetical protein